MLGNLAPTRNKLSQNNYTKLLETHIGITKYHLVSSHSPFHVSKQQMRYYFAFINHETSHLHESPQSHYDLHRR